MTRSQSLQGPAAESPRQRTYRLSVFAGPTGGHLFPAQSFAEGFRRRFSNAVIELVTSRRAEDLVGKVPAGVFERVHFLPDFGFADRFSWKTFKPFLWAPYLFMRSLFYLLKFRPDLCVGFASFASYPGMMTAHLLKIPTLIHEQNLVPGKATRWLAPHMDLAAASFPGTEFSSGLKKVCTVGLPLRSGLVNAREGKTGFAVPLSVLVVGGSQGAHGLNNAFVTAVGQLSPAERDKLAVTHIAGKQDCSRVESQYREWKMPWTVFPFCGEMNAIYNKTDLAVTRAGANTLFELAYFGVPALVVPYPHAGGHQEANARGFAAMGGLMFVRESAETSVWLRDRLREFINKPQELIGLSRAMTAQARPRATEDLVELAAELMG
ncbi:MAG: UDP-N-acetylglucosamine--N-acetylmuramyl-(pentapeptide) pyrophosphoryl-undecaprenol N-acetylglucosamine transferase [Candidatus Omnitrophica bacterium]|nr:UDP-N-acetylglucosamine--N-acetylmuramyl-(pentapeptide) pyrophosphoryl-undecaprenol N-acetylglucosamine transferase [Candidatus Omnitrophota bacterium]